MPIGRRVGLLAILAGVLVAAGATAARADTLRDIKSKGVLRVGVKADYPPFGYRAPDGNIIGIGPDLARDIAKRLGVKVELVPVTGANRTPFLQQGKIDVIIATMNDTPEREKVMEFVKPNYYVSGYNLMLPKSTRVTAWDQIKGKPICGVQGSYYSKSVAEKYGADVINFPGRSESLMALKQGRCIGLLDDDTAIEGDMVDKEWQDYGMPLESQDPLPWGIAVRKGEKDFAAYLSDVVKDWDKTGLILDLETKYGIARHSKFVEEMHAKYK